MTVGAPGEQTGAFAVVQGGKRGLDAGGVWGAGADPRYILETEGTNFASGLDNGNRMGGEFRKKELGAINW